MADAKQILVEVVVAERAFLDGKLVEVGTTRTIDLTPREGDRPNKLTADGKQRKLPKWAALPTDKQRLERTKAPLGGDTRPPEAQRAARAKAQGLDAAALT